MSDFIFNSNLPRSTYTLSDLQDRAAGDLELRGSQRITVKDWTRWGNEGQDKLAKLTSWCQDTTYVDTVAGQREYVIPARCLKIRNIRYLTRPLLEMTIERLDGDNWFWRNSGNGTPYCWYARGATAFGVYQTPASGIANAFSIEYVLIPPPVSAPDDFFYVPTAAEDAIIIYCKLMASLKDAHGEGKNRIAYYQQLWNQAVSELKEQVDSLEMNNVVCYGEEADYGGNRGPGLYWNPFTKLGP